MDSREAAMTLYAVLFASPEPLGTQDLMNRLGLPAREFADGLRELKEIAAGHSPFDVLEADGKLLLMTRPEYGKAVKEATGLRKLRLSEASLNALAYIAYNQPAFKSALDEVRGTDSASVLETLKRNGLIEAIGTASLPGAPVAYRTTDMFLIRFRLGSLHDLPDVEVQDAAYIDAGVGAQEKPGEERTMWDTIGLRHKETE